MHCSNSGPLPDSSSAARGLSKDLNCFPLGRSPGGTSTAWKAPPLHDALICVLWPCRDAERPRAPSSCARKPVVYANMIAEHGVPWLGSPRLKRRYVLTSVNFASSRALLMNNCATGLSVRLLSVMTAIGLRLVFNLMGNRLSGGVLVENLNKELGTIVRNRPVASRALRTGMVDVITVARGRSRPLVRNASAAIKPD